ncbi:MAG: sigma-70 family RNA polymerase sigma factor [Pseudomonadota bacterium]
MSTQLHRQQQDCSEEEAPVIQGNSEEVAASLYREHQNSLKSYVIRLVPGYQVSHAEDVVQETFVRTIKHLNNGKVVDSPKGFLYTTARNLITSMFYRGRKHTETDSSPDMDDYASSAHVCSPENRAFMQQKLDAFSTAIAALPERYQEAFVRRRIWGESCSEIAVKMQLSENAVSNYAALGWKQLGEYCDKHGIVLNDFFDQE